MLRRLVLSLVLALSAAAVAPQPPVNAGVENDIPGVPLTDTEVSGELSGSVHDLVYQVTLPKGIVLVASLTGDAGTDFDLYLWPSTATTVYAQTGYLTRSNDPGSTETITWAATTDTVVYLDVTRYGAAGGAFVLSVALNLDATPPLGRLLLDGGAAASASSTVDVLAGGYDSVSGVSFAALSEDGTTWTDWQPAPIQTTWTFSPGDGVKTLWAKAKNGVGLVSSPVTATIRVDTTPPTVTAVTPSRDSIVGVERPAISVTFSEAIDPDSWRDGGLTVTDPSGNTVPGALAYTAGKLTGTFTPSASLTLGTVYQVTLGRVRDVVGNGVQYVPSWTVKRLSPGTITLAASRKTIVYGQPVSFTGTRSPSGAVTLTLQQRAAGSDSWSGVLAATLSTDAYRLTASPSSSGRYRVELGATDASGPAVSNQVSIVVKRAVKLAGAGASVVRSVKAGRSVTLVAEVTPAVRNLPVSFKLYRRVGSRWVLSSSKTVRTGVSGAASYAWRPSAGRWAWRITAGGTPLLASNTSAYYEYRVGR